MSDGALRSRRRKSVQRRNVCSASVYGNRKRFSAERLDSSAVDGRAPLDGFREAWVAWLRITSCTATQTGRTGSARTPAAAANGGVPDLRPTPDVRATRALAPVPSPAPARILRGGLHPDF